MNEANENEEGYGLTLVMKILLATGAAALAIGAFILVVVGNVTVGLVLMLVGVSDLAAFYLLPKIKGSKG